MTRFKLDFAGEQPEFEVTRQGSTCHVVIEGREYACRLLLQEGSFLVLEIVRPDGARHLVHAAAAFTGDNRQLWVDGQTLVYRRARLQQEGAAGDGSLAATIPAIVSSVLVSPGDAVTAGQKLILLESMKMIIPIHAPHDAIVGQILCREGESVQAGKQLIILQPKDSQ